MSLPKVPESAPRADGDTLDADAIAATKLPVTKGVKMALRLSDADTVAGAGRFLAEAGRGIANLILTTWAEGGRKATNIDIVITLEETN